VVLLDSKAPGLDFFDLLVDRIATKVVDQLRASTLAQLPTASAELPKEWETREETLKRHNITDPTLNKWVRNGKITRKYLEGKPYYLVSSAYQTLNNQQ
jgi:hypothetical protein